MIALIKAIPFGILLTVIVCLFMGSAGSTGGYLHIRHFDVDVMNNDVRIYWSWMLFLASTFLAWALLLMIGD